MREKLEHDIINDPENDIYDINVIEKCGKVIVVYREKGQYNVSHTEVYNIIKWEKKHDRT